MANNSDLCNIQTLSINWILICLTPRLGALASRSVFIWTKLRVEGSQGGVAAQ